MFHLTKGSEMTYNWLYRFISLRSSFNIAPLCDSPSETRPSMKIGAVDRNATIEIVYITSYARISRRLFNRPRGAFHTQYRTHAGCHGSKTNQFTWKIDDF